MQIGYFNGNNESGEKEEESWPGFIVLAEQPVTCCYLESWKEAYSTELRHDNSGSTRRPQMGQDGLNIN